MCYSVGSQIQIGLLFLRGNCWLKSLMVSEASSVVSSESSRVSGQDDISDGHPAAKKLKSSNFAFNKIERLHFASSKRSWKLPKPATLDQESSPLETCRQHKKDFTKLAILAIRYTFVHYGIISTCWTCLQHCCKSLHTWQVQH